MESFDALPTIVILDQLGFRVLTDRDGSPAISPEEANLFLLSRKKKAHEAPAGAYREQVRMSLSEKNLARLADVVSQIKRHAGVSALVSLTEGHVGLAANLRATCGIPGMRPAQATLFRDKVHMKEALAASGLRVPANARIRSRDTVAELLSRYGKVVVKPCDGAGSVSTFILASDADVEAFFAQVPDAEKSHEVEEFIEGELLHVDTLLRHGETVVCEVSRYLHSTLSYADSDPLAAVTLDEGPSKEEIRRYAQRVHEALRLENGVTHLEVFRKADGEIVFCEVGARAGGAGVVPMMRALWGINLFREDVRAQASLSSGAPQRRAGAAGWLALRCREGRIARVSEVREFGDEEIAEVEILGKPGEFFARADNSGAFLARFAVVGSDAAFVERKIAEICARFRVDMEEVHS